MLKDKKNKMIQIIISEGYDVNKYINEKYNERQIYLIFSGIRLGLDISKYAKKDLSTGQMTKIFKELKKQKYKPKRREFYIVEKETF